MRQNEHYSLLNSAHIQQLFLLFMLRVIVHNVYSNVQ